MDPSRVAKRDGKAFEVIALERDTLAFIHPEYKLHQLPKGKRISPTGLLAIFELRPRTSGRPSFIARWDQKQQRLDIDMAEASDKERSRF